MTFSCEDKAAKDNNYRGLTVSNNTLYVTKGSGSNGVNTVYQVGTTRHAADHWRAAPMTICPGSRPRRLAEHRAHFYPFGLFFANPTTLYVADEGAGTNKSVAAGSLTAADLAAASGDTLAGLEKWSSSVAPGSSTTPCSTVSVSGRPTR